MPWVGFILQTSVSESLYSVQDLDLLTVATWAHAPTNFNLEKGGQLLLIPIEVHGDSKSIEVVAVNNDGYISLGVPTCTR